MKLTIPCLVAALLSASAARAADETPKGTTPGTTPEAQTLETGDQVHPRVAVVGRNRWENALDAKLTDFYDHKASNVESPTVMLTAEWNYKFKSETFLGLAFGGLPQPSKSTDDDTGIKTSHSTYYGGLYLGQGIFDVKPFRLVVGAVAGRGMLYARAKIPGQDAEAVARKYNIVEPGAFLTFFIYKGVEIGATASARQVKLLEGDEELAKDEDLSSTAFGLTFRTQRY